MNQPKLIITSCGARGPWDGVCYDNRQAEPDDGCFYLRWEKENFGFGETVFLFKKDGTIECENECLGKDFIKEVLDAFLDMVKLKDVPDGTDKAKD